MHSNPPTAALLKWQPGRVHVGLAHTGRSANLVLPSHCAGQSESRYTRNEISRLDHWLEWAKLVSLATTDSRQWSNLLITTPNIIYCAEIKNRIKGALRPGAGTGLTKHKWQNMHQCFCTCNFHVSPKTYVLRCTMTIFPCCNNGMVRLFWKSLDDASVPDDWKCANICPTFKKGNKNSAENYRDILLVILAWGYDE